MIKSITLLRIGIAIVFFYAAIASFIMPLNWIGYFPTFIRGHIPDSMLLNLFSIFELTLGVWILSGWKTFYAGLASAATLLGIIVFNYFLFDIVFRDIAILFASLALAVNDMKAKKF